MAPNHDPERNSESVCPAETRCGHKAPGNPISRSLGVPGTSGQLYLQDTRVGVRQHLEKGRHRNSEAPLRGHACPGWSQAPRQLKNFEAVSVDISNRTRSHNRHHERKTEPVNCVAVREEQTQAGTITV